MIIVLQNMGAVNEINAKRMIFYLMQHPGKEVPVDEIVEQLDLDISHEEANRKLRALVWSDLIQEIGSSLYGGLNDPMLERVLRIEYSWELEHLNRSQMAAQLDEQISAEILAAKDEMIASLRGQLNNWVGRVAEAFIERLMKRSFQGQTVEGERYFHHSNAVQLSRFNRVHSVFAHPPGATRNYQVDLYAEPLSENEPPWVVEIKNWERSVGQPEVEKFLSAADNLVAERGHTQIICWFYSRNGFTSSAERLLKKQGVLYTDQDGLVQLLSDLQVVEQMWE